MSSEDTSGAGVPAPELLEVAGIWWDVERVPHVVWDRSGRRFALIDPAATENRLHLAAFADGLEDPASMARVLAEGLAACDFPPTERRASPNKVLATLRAAGRTERPL